MHKLVISEVLNQKAFFVVVTIPFHTEFSTPGKHFMNDFSYFIAETWPKNHTEGCFCALLPWLSIPREPFDPQLNYPFLIPL